jgi:outer membrane protein assembly factor BamE (lipoprotein component of BamABCDE complex)
MVKGETGLSLRIYIRRIIAASLLICAVELAAGERPYAGSSKSAASVSYQELFLRALQAEEPIRSGTPFTWEDADKVQNGMTEAEVVAILGQPYSRRESGDDAILIWSYTTSEAANAVAYRFSKGRVVGSHRIVR